MEALGFRSIAFVIDAERVDPMSDREQIDALGQLLREYDPSTTSISIFTNPGALQEIRKIVPPPTEVREHSLTWTDKDLGNLVRDRLRARGLYAYGLYDYFIDEYSDELLISQAQGNPRRLVRMYREIAREIANSDKLKLTRDQIEKILDRPDILPGR